MRSRRAALRTGVMAALGGAMFAGWARPASAKGDARMTTEANVAVVRGFYEGFNRGDLDAALAQVAPQLVNHGRPAGKDGLRGVLEDILGRFPDCRMEPKEIVAAEDDVVARCIYSGTHLGVQKRPFVDGGLLLGVPPTGRHFAVQHIHWWRLKEGLIVEHRANRDDVGMMLQLGLLTLPPLPADWRGPASPPAAL